MKDQKKAAAVSVALPKLNKPAAFTTWSEGKTAFLDGHINVYSAPMSYLICDIVYPKIFPELIANKPYSKEFPSIIFELIGFLVYNEDKYSDNKVFQLLDIVLKVSLIHPLYHPSVERKMVGEDGLLLCLYMVAQINEQRWLKG